MHRFREVLFVATRPGGTPALLRAAALTRANLGRLTIARVVDVGSEDWRAGPGARAGEIGSLLRAAYEVELSALAARVETAGMRPRTRVLWGRPDRAVIEAVREHGHDLVVKEAAAGGGVRERLFGSLDQHLMRKCPCPVWLFDPDRAESFRSVLAAVDVSRRGAVGEALAARVIQVGSSLAVREGASFHVVHAWSLHSEALLRSRARGAQRARLRARLRATRRNRGERLQSLVAAEAVRGVEPEWHLVKGPAAVGIQRVAGRVAADVVVMGTECRSGIQGLLIGNTAEAVLSQIRCSVLTVKPSGHAVSAEPMPGASARGRTGAWIRAAPGVAAVPGRP